MPVKQNKIEQSKAKKKRSKKAKQKTDKLTQIRGRGQGKKKKLIQQPISYLFKLYL